MRPLRAAQTLASRSLLLSARSLHGATSPAAAAAAAAGGQWGDQPPPPTPASSSRAMPAGIVGAVSFSLTFATMAAAEAKAKEKERPPLDLLPQNVVLYQYQACPFCNKVRGNFSFTERFAVKYAGAPAMYMVAKKLKRKYNITDERASLYDAANTWTEALNGRDFLGGSKPNLADLAAFGVLRPIRYLRAGKDMVEHTQIGDWYQRMEDAIGEPSRIQE